MPPTGPEQAQGAHYTEAENARLREALERLRAKLTQEAGGKRASDQRLGRAIGKTQPAVRKYREGGGFSRPVAQRIADALGETLDEILGQDVVAYYLRAPDVELRAVLEYRLKAFDHGWSGAAIGAAVGKSIDGERHSRAEWEKILTALTAQLRKRPA